uniref:Diadenylate cyclase n=1 Tax=Eubacterium cellulosolvens (strain ATCC 43171 / JCM 9499 / 6) TaxID=633697 RepID=I5ASW4_EUBC6
MDTLLSWLQIYVLSWLQPPKQIEIIDIVQILLLSYIVYKLILWMQSTRSYTLLRGILFIIAFVVVANILHMEVIVWLMGNLSVAAITAVVIIFQPELRKVLEQMGHNTVYRYFMLWNRSDDDNYRFSDHTINELVRASFEMGEVKTGALIVVERETRLDEFVKTGIPVDAVVTGQLLINIFEHNTPLHDGAVIIRNDRVAAATCYLPLSDNMELSKKLGTRHRAGVGVSELTDSLTIIVSEETGSVSYAQSGRLHAAVSPSQLKEALQSVQAIFPEKVTLLKKGGHRNHE